jgi:hypothetical protein
VGSDTRALVGAREPWGNWSLRRHLVPTWEERGSGIDVVLVDDAVQHITRPTSGLLAWRWLKAVASQHVGDASLRDADPEFLELANDA